MSVSAHILPSLRLFMSEIIDYAGLFPPARLPLDEAIHNFAQYRQGDEAWIMGSFVIPVDLLTALAPYDELLRGARPCRFSVLGSTGPEFLQSLENNLKEIEAFETSHRDHVTVESMEVKSDTMGDTRRIVSTLDTSAEILRAHARDGMPIYIEVPWQHEFDGRLVAVAAAVARARESLGLPLALKIRSGGLDSALFPDSARLARFVAVCLRYGVPFKATAGLHHPVRQYHESVQTRMHGFLNVFGGAALFHAGSVSEEELATLLDDEEPTSFAFDAAGMRWRDRRISLEELASARRFAHSFGSCDFDEPRDDLRAMDLL